MAALRQSIEKAKDVTPKTAAKQAAPAAPAAAAKLPTAGKGKRNVKGSPDQREMLLPIAGGAPRRKQAWPQRKRRRNRRRKNPAHGRRRDSFPFQRAMNPIAAAFAMSMKKAETNGKMMKACAQAPCSLVTAVILAMAVGVAPRLTPVKPAEITAA